MLLVEPLLDVLNDETSFPANTTCTGLEVTPLSTTRVTFVGLESAHVISSVIPPRTRAPIIDPVGQAEGRAGKRLMVRGIEVSATSSACRSPFYEIES